jgi:hypothetical protein
MLRRIFKTCQTEVRKDKNVFSAKTFCLLLVALPPSSF